VGGVRVVDRKIILVPPAGGDEGLDERYLLEGRIGLTAIRSADRLAKRLHGRLARIGPRVLSRPGRVALAKPVARPNIARRDLETNAPEPEWLATAEAEEVLLRARQEPHESAELDLGQVVDVHVEPELGAGFDPPQNGAVLLVALLLPVELRPAVLLVVGGGSLLLLGPVRCRISPVTFGQAPLVRIDLAASQTFSRRVARLALGATVLLRVTLV